MEPNYSAPAILPSAVAFVFYFVNGFLLLFQNLLPTDFLATLKGSPSIQFLTSVDPDHSFTPINTTTNAWSYPASFFSVTFSFAYSLISWIIFHLGLKTIFCCFLVYFICRLTTKQSSRSSSSAAATAAGAATTHSFYNDKLTTVYVLNYVDNFSKTDATKSQPTAVPRSQIQSLLDDFHFSEFVGHPGGTRMYQILKHRFSFPRMKKVIQDYVASCEICCRTKSTNQKLGTLGNVPIPRARWQTVAMDIVSGFPETTTPFGETVNSVLLLVDHMSSRTHLYPIHSTASSETIVNILKFFFFPQHGFPTTFCTDRGSVFSSQFFQSFLKAFNIQQFISVTGHHQSNGKAERFIQSLQQYLRTFISDQNSWVNLLPTAEFTINSLPSMVLGGFSPFEIDLGYNPSGVQDFAYQSNATNSANSTRSSFFIWEEMDRLASAAVTSLKAAHGKDKLHYDLNRKDIAIKPGDKVYININHLQNIPDVKNKSLPASLRSKFIGPYEVLKVLSPVNIEVAMPPSSRRPNGIFHISQLRHQKSIQNAEFIAPNGPPQEFKIYTDGSVEMEIDEILGHVKRGKGYALEVKFCDGTVQLVRLKDLLKTAPELTKEYLKRVGLGSVLSE